ncbi:hypothetical protein ACPW96_15375 [Micromonospora sp. DT81.3]|uniref:hypothetical protein n=1 Tax=Actinomycetes TaxID=1760 RepID=UPI003CF9DA86
MDTTTTPARLTQPLVIRVTVVLIYLSGLSNVVLGVLVLLSRYTVSDANTVLPVSLLGAAIILLGLLTIAGGSAIARGSRLARLLVTIYVAVLMVLDVLTILTTETWDLPAGVKMLLGAVIIVAMWVPPGSRYFVIRRVDDPAVGTA